jgi:hypothetical protein
MSLGKNRPKWSPICYVNTNMYVHKYFPTNWATSVIKKNYPKKFQVETAQKIIGYIL